MDEGKPKLRKPDGSPEPRSVDEVLRDAIRNGEFDNLPGKGRPIDLEGYFSGASEERVAHKLLKDNRALPPPLQDRKEAEALRQSAEAFRSRMEGLLSEGYLEIREATSPLAALFPTRDALVRCLDLPGWPEHFAEPGQGPVPSMQESLRAERRLRTLTLRHRSRAEAFIRRYSDLVSEGNACVRRLNGRLAATGRIGAGFQMMPLVDAARRIQETLGGLPQVQVLPEDAPYRIRAHFKEPRQLPWQWIRRQYVRWFT